MKRLLDCYDAVLLDMGNTFMFEVDRFGDQQDYHATYRRLGGREQSPPELRGHVTRLLKAMVAATGDPRRYDAFPTARALLNRFTETAGLPLRELDLVEEVFARHERGTVSASHARTLRDLHTTHPLGIVSNVWSRSVFFEEALSNEGLRDLFAARIWSSDHGCIKPSARLFEKALYGLRVDPGRAVHVGDNPKRDVAGAKALGMGAVWIANTQRPLVAEHPRPDAIIGDLTELLNFEGV